MKHELSAKLLLAALSVLAFLVFLEIVLRILGLKDQGYFHPEADPILHHKFKPKAVGTMTAQGFATEYRINSLGFRDREYSLQKPPGTFRILMVGDSFTEGYGVNIHETCSKQLEESLQHLPGPRTFEVINTGVSGYSPLLEYLFLKNVGLQLSPDLVILLSDLNDVSEDLEYTHRARFDEHGFPLAVRPAYEPLLATGLQAKIKDWFKENTFLYSFLFVRISVLLHYIKRDRDFVPGDIRIDRYAMLRDSYVDDPEYWKPTQRYLLLIRDMLRERGIGFWLVLYPYGHQISPKEWDGGREFWRFKRDTVYSTWPQERMAAWARANNITLLDLCPMFKELSLTIYPLYGSIDGHWSPIGHRRVADTLFKQLQILP